MSRLLTAGVALGLALSAAGVAPARADSDEAFFRKVSGQWSGPGEIVAGKYKGTKFVCNFAGNQSRKSVGVALEGSCRVGLFSQPMRAEVVRAGSSYRGAFQDGAAGKGLDIVSGDVSGNRMIVGLDRKQLKGAMIARLDGDDQLAVTISVTVASQLVPVIGMSLKREGGSRQSALTD
ncbi:hypothetical protein E3C22_02990 [Jiella endophytica]|uniref:Uncharacterized protein n=2 Tax=Jiella endophytica TaxID=2558362 RepID=A0A4Y8RV77_9HYPH|nr:hypothetical protein [Jiella endophytica]TFF27441.1 hypothetical protein E3C22_02990 [Jiella endophytica]